MESGTTNSAHRAASVHLKSLYGPGTLHLSLCLISQQVVGREVPRPRFTEKEVGGKQVKDFCEQAPG